MSISKALHRIAFFKVKQNLSALSLRELEALRHCIKAGNLITAVYGLQVYPNRTNLLEVIDDQGEPEASLLRKYLEVNGTPWDLFNDNKPFVPGVGPRPQTGAFYPEYFTEEEWNSWLENHPEDRESFESPYTVIERHGPALFAVPYSIAYGGLLGKAANELELAAELLNDGPLKVFLNLRAKAFRTNDYFESDMAWIDTNGYPFEVTIGPYEVYTDKLFGIKAMFESFIALPDKDATNGLAKFSSSVPEFDKILSGRWKYKPRGLALPLEVVADIHRGGEAAFGRKFTAYNLPNDRRIHELKGSKKVFSRTVMEAKFNTLGMKIAERTLKPSDFKRCQFRYQLLFVLAHELSHGIGPTQLETKLKDLHSMLEEAKADTLGIELLTYFLRKGLITKEDLYGSMATHVVASVQGWRMGFSQAHSTGRLVQFNWLKHHGAISYGAEESKVFNINYDSAVQAMITLSHEIIALQIEGDYEKAYVFVKKWSEVSAEITEMISRLEDIPIEVHPIFG
jgi:hypothetical protein